MRVPPGKYRGAAQWLFLLALTHDVQLALVPYALTQARRVRQGASAIAGNHVVLAISDRGAYVLLAHLRYGSIQVAVGNHVKEGEQLGEGENSATAPNPAAGEVPRLPRPNQPPPMNTTTRPPYTNNLTSSASTTDPEARLYRKGNNTAAELCDAGHLLIENRSALIADAELGTADGYAERSTALGMLSRLPKTKRRRTVAGDKGYDTAGFVADARTLGFTPHVAQNTTNRRSAIDGRTIRHPRYQVSQAIRARVEEPFGWIKTIGGGHKLRYIGRERNRAWFKMTAAVYNIIRIAALDTATA
jgi:hypothetical protein